MYVLHRTFGLIWQKVIYLSIPLVARVKRRAASIHRTSERAHSRKPALIHPHTYKVPERRQAGLISESFLEEFFSETSKSKWAQEEAGVLPAPTLFLSCSILRYRLPLIVRVIMMSLFRSLVPVREMGKGKGGGHQDISCIPTAYMFLGQYT